MKIASIGVGNMGGAIVESWLNKKIVHQKDLLLFDANKESFIGTPVMSPDEASMINDADVILLAVKPQMISQVSSQYAEYINDSLIISILAGTKSETVKDAFPGNVVVRWMPNLALKVDAGVVGHFSNDDLSSEQKVINMELMSIFKVQKRMDSEEELDIVTALSGSAPAFYYVFAKALEDIASKYGYSEDEAFEITKEVFIGASKLFEESDMSFAELISKVASKGGTTEAALNSFKENGFTNLIEKAVKAAIDRAEELSNS